MYIKEKGFPLFSNSLAISSITVLLLRIILHFGLPSSRRRDDVVLLVLYTTIYFTSISRLVEKQVLIRLSVEVLKVFNRLFLKVVVRLNTLRN